MDKHFRLTNYKDPDNINHCFLISNRGDDVIGTVEIRSYEKDYVPDIVGLINDLSFDELKDIMTDFIRICEKDMEYDKAGQSYYVAKRWIKNNI